MTTSLLSAHTCSRLAFFTRISYLVFPFLRFPLDLIKVTEGTPLFSAEECASVPIPRLFHSSSAIALMDSDGVLTSGDVPVNEVVVVGISWEVGGIVPLTVLVGAG